MFRKQLNRFGFVVRKQLNRLGFLFKKRFNWLCLVFRKRLDIPETTAESPASPGEEEESRDKVEDDFSLREEHNLQFWICLYVEKKFFFSF